MASIIWARVESEMFRLQPVGMGVTVGPVGIRVVTALSLRGGSCLDEEERVYYAVEV